MSDEGFSSRISFSPKGITGLSFIVRILPIPYFFLQGNLLDPHVRASNDKNDPSKLARSLFRDGG